MKMTKIPNDEFPVLITRRLKFRRKLGEALTDIIVEIGHPYWIESDVEAACPVAIRGAIGRVNDIRSIDPMSAMKQAISFVEKYLEHPTDGEKIFWPDGESYDGE
jgi:hypothetical protein